MSTITALKANTFADYVAHLEAAKQTPLVKNALALAKGCLRYGALRHLDQSMGGNCPTYREVFNRALLDAARATGAGHE